MDLLSEMIWALLVVAISVYWFSTRNFGYFKKLGIPFLKPTPIFGNMTGIVFKTKSMPDIILETYNQHADAKYVGFYDFTTPIIVLRDPELVKSIAIKHFENFPDHKMFTEAVAEPLFQKNLFALKGDTWRDMRTVLSPAFTSSKMKMMFKIVSQCAMDFGDYLEKLDPRPEAMDVKDIFGRYTLDVIASSAFGISVNSMKDRDNEFYKTGKSIADFGGVRMIKFFVMRTCPKLAKFLGLKFLDDETSNFFVNVIQNTIATREAQGIVRPDMIHLMMQARDVKSAISAEDMTAQAFVFLLGGFDSPAATMSFAAQLLALNQDVQRKLQAEIDQVIEKCSGEVSYEDLHAMKYLDAVISETLRLFPPAAFMDRVGSKSFTLPPALPGLKPLEIKAGQSIWIPLYGFHHDPQYFQNPEKFDPERFGEDRKSGVSPLTYFPFGLGPRICIANRFALMEVKLALFHVFAKCNFLPSYKTQADIKLSARSFNIAPEGGFWLKIEPRK